MSAEFLDLIISAIRSEAKDTLSFELKCADGKELPEFSPGAHLEVHLSNSLIRHYSLFNDSTERKRYQVAVSLAPESRGGSSFLHGGLKVGQTLRVRPPRNNFPLVADAEHYNFIAGGIGITPMLSMVRWCERQGKNWHLHYLARTKLRAAFYEELLGFDREKVTFHFLDDSNGTQFDVESAISQMRSDSHIYCCGPMPLMQRVEQAASTRPSDHVHFEWFSARPKDESEVNDGFKLIIKSTGQEYLVPADKTILDVLEENDYMIPYSCREGICGSCEATVVCGTPDHRDTVLSDEAKAAGKTMLVCVSRSKTPVLELDI
ncbi:MULTISPECIES: PDR/VanB family oxidoreductase [unclassified Pseudomonas]|uniref:PDR/VanB family oxidoreductase n=1 Tax=unclassified Pseudomonas TaxID=196821 RepID=UPI002456AD9D|nr:MULTISPECIES: PDR/VanB family oxidoreductase [unclassified Pseudomonas]MDH4561323.1 oxidoreductase [Pseudomonas sp. BN411]MDH4656985.1 oxidoreductase [Pseudomonas sp. BN606]